MAVLNKSDRMFKYLFLIAAIYDLVLGILFFLYYNQIFKLFDITRPIYPMYLQLSAAFVIAMGVGYFFIYLNMYRNIDLVKLGIVYKIVYSGLTSYFYFNNKADALFLWFAIIDVIFLVFFVWFLNHANKDKRYLKWK
ncbi:MAG: hypothetical protein ABII01_04925 [Candidatus Woesearchaeota archaeon]